MAWCLPNDSLLVSSAIFFLFFVAICHSYAHAASRLYSQLYEGCRPSKCGNSLLAFPFALGDSCGPLYNAHCNRTLTFNVASDFVLEPVTYRVVGDITENSYNNRTVTIADDLLFDCQALSRYLDLEENWAYPDSEEHWEDLGVMFSLTQEYAFGTFLNCTQPPGIGYLQPVPCMDCETTNNVCFFASGFSKVENCMSYRIAIPKNYNITAEKKLRQFLQRGFPITWNKTVDCQSCETTNGICGANPSSYHSYDFEFACLCPHNAHRKNCSDGEIIKNWE